MSDDFDLDNTQEITPSFLDVDKVKKNIPSYSSQKLCEMIVCDRYFGFGKEISTFCMEELANRRIAGDQFDFENYIEAAHKELPPLDFEMPDLKTILQNAIAQNVKK